jgi:hypothetical protein
MQPPAVEGPYFDELAIGQDFGRAPSLTLTPGLAAAHQAITGDRLAIAIDPELCHQVTGGGRGHSPAWSGMSRSGSRRSPRTSRRTSSTAAWPSAVSLGSATRCGPRHGSSRSGRTSLGKAGRPPGSRSCGSRPSTSSDGRCWTSGAAPCCRCAIRPAGPGMPMTSTLPVIRPRRAACRCSSAAPRPVRPAGGRSLPARTAPGAVLAGGRR